jgi:hypothetical protein
MIIINAERFGDSSLGDTSGITSFRVAAVCWSNSLVYTLHEALNLNRIILKKCYVPQLLCEYVASRRGITHFTQKGCNGVSFEFSVDVKIRTLNISKTGPEPILADDLVMIKGRRGIRAVEIVRIRGAFKTMKDASHLLELLRSVENMRELNLEKAKFCFPEAQGTIRRELESLRNGLEIVGLRA